MPRGTISGTAPRAHVIAYKVCGDDGCFGTDSVAAIQKAIQDGVNVINFSISGGSDPVRRRRRAGLPRCLRGWRLRGRLGGQQRPRPDTVDHRGPWVTTVGASTTDRASSASSRVAAGNGDTLAVAARPSRESGEPAPVVLASTLARRGLRQSLRAGQRVPGKIVACERPAARIAKSFNVAQGGAVGMLLYEHARDAPGHFADSHWVPTVHLASAEGAALLSFIGTHSGVTATFTWGLPRRARATGWRPSAPAVARPRCSV